MIPARFKDRLVTATFGGASLEAMDRQIRDIVHHRIMSFSARKSIEAQLWGVARDCYVQGLLDGNQVSNPTSTRIDKA